MHICEYVVKRLINQMIIQYTNLARIILPTFQFLACESMYEHRVCMNTKTRLVLIRVKVKIDNQFWDENLRSTTTQCSSVTGILGNLDIKIRTHSDKLLITLQFPFNIFELNCTNMIKM